MGDAGFDIDAGTSQAWREFTARLGDFLAGMQESDVLQVGTLHEADADDGVAPHVWFLNWGEGRLRGEVCSNANLAPKFWLDAEDESTLLALGWWAPEPDREWASDNWYHLTRGGGADELAVMAVGALREVYGVEHPALLVVAGHGSDDVPDLGIPVARQEDDVEPDEPLAVMAESPEELQEAVDLALRKMFRFQLEKDEDGDIPVLCQKAVLFVRVREDEPTIELFSNLVDGITDHEAAVREVAILNRDTQFFKFVLRDDRVLARCQLPALPFAPKQLRTLVTLMADMLDDTVDDLAERTGGQRWFALDEEETAEAEATTEIEESADVADEPTVEPRPFQKRGDT